MHTISDANFDSIIFAKKSFIRVMNIVCMVSAFLALLSAFVGRDSVPYLVSMVSLAGIFLAALVFYQIFKVSLGKYFLPIITTVWICFMCIAFGSRLGNQHYLIISLVAFALFSKNDLYKYISIVVLIFLAIFISIYQSNHLPLYPLPQATDILLGMNVFTPLIIIVLICWNVMKDSKRSQEIIELQRKSLSDSNEFKDKLLSIIGHDMRSPFTSAKGLLHLLELDHLSKEEKETLLKELQSDIDMSLKTLDNILNWASQSYYGAVLNTRVKKETLDICSMVEIIISSFNYLATQKKVLFKNTIPKETFALGDYEQIIFVIRNLTSNALKFSFEAQTIEFSVLDEKDKLTISIRDQGAGMTEDMLSSLFKITTRFSKEGTAQEKGSGLGLIFCKDFVENNQGSLSIESEEGKGTTVRFTLPK